jgi:RNA polymerase sigma factor for flagellar operon FliA
MSIVDTTQRMVLDHLQIVEQEVRVLLRRVPGHVERDELLATGYLALVACARRFTGENGGPFARTARPRVRGALLDHLRSLDWASRGVRRKAREVEVAREELAASLGRTPTETELADALGVTVAEVAASTDAVRQATVLSLQSILAAAADPLVGQVPGPEETTLRRELVGYLSDAIAALPARLRKVITECFFEDRPAAETAADLGVSESRVSQMRTKALGLLRDGLNVHLEPGRVAPEQRQGCAARRRQDYFAAIAAKGDLRSRLMYAGAAHTAA